MVRNKRGQLATQFNWVFILIAGAIILMFFVSVSIWYKNQQEVKLAGVVVTELDSIFSTAKESPKTAKINRNFPDVDISFTCDPYACNYIGCPSGFSGGSVTTDTSAETIFTLEEINAQDMISWALTWELPYKVTNFLYLTNPRVRYILIYNTDSQSFLGEVNSLLSENDFIVKELINYEDYTDGDIVIDDKNDEFVRIISFVIQEEGEDIPYTIIQDFDEDQRWDMIYVDGNSNVGYVYFEDETLPYLGLPMLIGAIYSETSDIYKCNAYKALNQLRLVSTVYHKRTDNLYDNVLSTDSSYCQIYYTADVLDAIETINETSELDDFDDLEDLSQLLNAVQTLEDTDQLAIINDCPRLY